MNFVGAAALETNFANGTPAALGFCHATRLAFLRLIMSDA